MKNWKKFTINSLVSCAVILTLFGIFAVSGETRDVRRYPYQAALPVDLPEPEQVTPEHELSEPQATDFRQFEATAYCDYGLTFSGVLVHRGIVAADPTILPIGTIIELSAGDYSGIYVVMDTGGLVKGKIVDIYMPDYDEAIQFGRQPVGLRILRHGWLPEPTTSVSYTGAG